MIKPFPNSKQPTSKTKLSYFLLICDIYNGFFSHLAVNIGFKDDIRDDFQMAKISD